MPGPAVSAEAMPERRLLSPAILSFSLAAFAIGVAEFVVIGLMTSMAAEIGVGVAEVGLLVSVYAVGITVGAPAIAIATRRLAARPLLLALLAAFAFANVVVGAAGGLAVLAAARAVAGASHGAFFAVATARVPALVAPEKAPFAIALMFVGLTLAMVVGVPIGMTLGHAFGWRIVFFAVAVLAIAATAALAATLEPSQPGDAPFAGRAPASAYADARLLALYGATVFGFGGAFYFFGFVEPFMTRIVGLGEAGVPLVMGLVGVGSLLGNLLGGKLPGRLGVPGALAAAALAQMLCLLGIWLAPGRDAFVALLFAWSVATFSIAPIVQAGVVARGAGAALDPRIAASCNVAAFNVGISAATYLAAKQVDAGGLDALPAGGVFAAGLALAASAALAVIYRRSARACFVDPDTQLIRS